MDNFFKKYKTPLKLAGGLLVAICAFGITLTVYVFNEIKQNQEYIHKRHQELVEELKKAQISHQRGSKVMNDVFAASERETKRVMAEFEEARKAREARTPEVIMKEQDERFKQLDEKEKRTWAEIDKNFGKGFQGFSKNQQR
ncbi:MAG: hypothetical protein ACK5TR_05050 [Alphaproteobacteria bacterium]|jgi:hypothetical protein